MRRVVITGLGLVTPLGADVETTWSNLLAGKSGAGPITRFDASDQKAKIACEVKGKDHEYGFDPDKRIDHKIQRQVDPMIIFGLDAAGQALEDAGLDEMDDALKERAGVTIGSGIGGLPGDRIRIDQSQRTRSEPGQPAFRPRSAYQPHRWADLDPLRPDGPEPRCRYRLFLGRPRDWRCSPHDQG